MNGLRIDVVVFKDTNQSRAQIGVHPLILANQWFECPVCELSRACGNTYGTTFLERIAAMELETPRRNSFLGANSPDSTLATNHSQRLLVISVYFGTDLTSNKMAGSMFMILSWWG